MKIKDENIASDIFKISSRHNFYPPLCFVLFLQWIIKGQSRRERRYLLADLICFLILGPLVIASSYLCAQGAWYYLVFAVDKWTGTGLVILSLFLWCIFGFWLIVTIRYHRRCWLDWKNHNHVVKLV